MKRFDQINVIPFIDIMLVLLAIVLTTASFISQGKLYIDVPKASKPSSPVDMLESVELAIDKELKLFYKEQEISLDELKIKVSSLDKTTPISIKVDQTVPFQKFVSLLDLLKQQNFEKLAIITQTRK